MPPFVEMFMRKDMMALLNIAEKRTLAGGDEARSRQLVQKFGSRHLVRTVVLTSAYVFLVFGRLETQ